MAGATSTSGRSVPDARARARIVLAAARSKRAAVRTAALVELAHACRSLIADGGGPAGEQHAETLLQGVIECLARGRAPDASMVVKIMLKGAHKLRDTSPFEARLYEALAKAKEENVLALTIGLQYCYLASGWRRARDKDTYSMAKLLRQFDKGGENAIRFAIEMMYQSMSKAAVGLRSPLESDKGACLLKQYVEIFVPNAMLTYKSGRTSGGFALFSLRVVLRVLQEWPMTQSFIAGALLQLQPTLFAIVGRLSESMELLDLLLDLVDASGAPHALVGRAQSVAIQVCYSRYNADATFTDVLPMLHRARRMMRSRDPEADHQIAMLALLGSQTDRHALVSMLAGSPHALPLTLFNLVRWQCFVQSPHEYEDATPDDLAPAFSKEDENEASASWDPAIEVANDSLSFATARAPRLLQAYLGALQHRSDLDSVASAVVGLITEAQAGAVYLDGEERVFATAAVVGLLAHGNASVKLHVARHLSELAIVLESEQDLLAMVAFAEIRTLLSNEKEEGKEKGKGKARGCDAEEAELLKYLFKHILTASASPMTRMLASTALGSMLSFSDPVLYAMALDAIAQWTIETDANRSMDVVKILFAEFAKHTGDAIRKRATAACIYTLMVVSTCLIHGMGWIECVHSTLPCMILVVHS